MNEQEKQELLLALNKKSAFVNELVVKAVSDEAFKQRLLIDPKGVYAEAMDQEIPEGIDIQVVEEMPGTFYLVLPRQFEEPNVEGELSDEALKAIAGGRLGSAATGGGHESVGWF